MGKKAQVQVFETMGVIVIFFIIVFIGFIFYGRMVKEDINKERYELSQLRSIAIAQRVMFLPELQCSDDSLVKESCIDILKLESAIDEISNNQVYYYDLLEFSVVDIARIYPDERKWTAYSRRPNDFRSSFNTSVPVSLYNPITKSYGFGVITIETRAR